MSLSRSVPDPVPPYEKWLGDLSEQARFVQGLAERGAGDSATRLAARPVSVVGDYDELARAPGKVMPKATIAITAV